MAEMKLFSAGWLACGLLCAAQAVASSADVCSDPARDGSSAQRAVDAASYNIRYDSIDHPVIGREGMVATQSELASAIGAQVLRDGGNAVDSAVAVGFALAVTLPRAGNLGGSGFMLLHLAEEKRTIALEYYSQAPASIRIEQLRKPDGTVDEEKRYSRLGAGVPGTVAGLWHVHQKYGKLPWKRLLHPAIDLAAKGIVVSEDFAYALDVRRDRLSRDPAAAKALYKSNGESYRAGERFVQKDLAWSLREISKGGADAFYRGSIARKIVADMQANGGAITLDDLGRYQLREQEPIWSDYRGYRLALMPPPASGVLLAELLNVIENFPMKELGSNSVASIHVIAEASKRVFADRGVYFGGYPDYEVPVSGLTSKEYARSLAKNIDLTKSTDTAALKAGDPMRYESRDTTHYSIMDSAGNAVSNTYTLGSSFGAHVMVAGTGILLNDHIYNFALHAGPVIPHSLDTSVANVLAPGKRATSAITPVIVFRGERPYLVSGSPDGARIIPAMAQLLVNVIDHGLNVAEATGRPRVFQNMTSGELELEPGHPADVVRLLQERGHKVKPVGNMGSTQSVMCTNGRFLGGADTRRPDASAIGVN
ncbi:gamma-glutamyltransferase [Steroidobacter agaridevorans]|uniref:Glutathione hydrolase proenzyme n=1 Tax=Steroidobacter agaridevorans TaxID=2695856 RepID=A0A829YDQ4_9GAMM|nr:gamma-glutamyltransferase [Steroidobacter agaridevorans]GFE81409.1 gamma-glutamyltransferase [Steroidobacter agaridevorans]